MYDMKLGCCKLHLSGGVHVFSRCGPKLKKNVFRVISVWPHYTP